jgi:acyl-CoA dehydrogenase
MSRLAAAADVLLVDTVDRLLAETATFEAIERAEEDGWAPTVWDALAAAGFPWVGIDEGAGGSGGSLVDAAALLRSVGAHAAPVPLAETGVLGGWLLASAGLAIPAGPLGVVPRPGALTTTGGRLVGSATVAWARRAERIVGLVADGTVWRVVVLRPEQVQIERATNMAGEPRDRVQIDVPLGDVDAAVAGAGVDGDAFVRRGAITRLELTAGALGAMSQLTVDYTSTRRQFGKPVASFQAVQQHLVTVAQCAVKAAIAADAATRAADQPDAAFAVGAARVVSDDAAVVATRAAHQAHGAMGVTREYQLHHLSRRLWAWRHEYGTGREWARRLGAMVHSAGADALFPSITR